MGTGAAFSRWVGKLWELCQSLLAMPSSDPSAAMYFYFNILKPQGPAPKLCTQNSFPSILQMFVPNHGSQAGQNTAGRNKLNRKGEPIQTGCLMYTFLSVNIPQQSQWLRERMRIWTSYGQVAPGHLLDTSSPNIWLIVPNPDGIQSYRMCMVLTKKRVVMLQHTSSKAKGNLLCIVAPVSILMEQEQLRLAWQ